MNKHPAGETPLKDIDTILNELNALCSAHDAQRATGTRRPLYATHVRPERAPTAVKELGPNKEKTAALPVPETNTSPLANPRGTVPVRDVRVAVDLIIEYYTADGRFDAHCATTDTVFQLWDRLTLERGPGLQIAIRPRTLCNPTSRTFETLHPATLIPVEAPQVSGPSGDNPAQTMLHNRLTEKLNGRKAQFSDDILPKEDASAPTIIEAAVTPDPPPCRVLVMNSQDGAEYAWPVLYPALWTWDEAMQRAKAAVAVVKAEDRLAILDGETGIGNYRHRLTEELRERGFMVPDTDEGPVWD